jgi:5-methylthioadenosine/S-adenosylhomocysteine deaminase
MSILIKDVWFKGNRKSVLIEGKYIKTIADEINESADIVIDGKGKGLIPGMINGHGHAAMTLFRGYADDMPLEEWLNTKVWPQEAKLTQADVYAGARLACLEMIKNGTTAFMDMYWFINGTAQAVQEMGLRAKLAHVIMDNFDQRKREKCMEEVENAYQNFAYKSDLIDFDLAPHALYTVSKELLLWTIAFAKKHNLLIQIHGAETQTEYDICVEKYGLSPIRFFDSIGLLNPNLSIAHCVYLDDEEIKLLAKNGVKVVYNVNSNMKLASGIDFKYQQMKEAGVTVCMGTDGCCSSNNLDMFETAKHAALVQKGLHKNPELLPADHAFDLIAKNGGLLFDKKIGKTAEGYLADVCLVDMNTPVFVPKLSYNLISNLIYSANGSCIDTVICNGKIIMQNRKVAHEQEILEEAQAVAERLFL